MRQAGGADLAPLTRDRKAGDGGFSPDPVGRLPVGALRGRHGEADAGAGRFGLGIGRDTGDEHAGGAPGIGQQGGVAGVVGRANHHRLQHQQLLRQPVQPLQRLRHQQQRGNFGQACRHCHEVQPGRLQGATVLRRGAGQLGPCQREVLLGAGLGHADPLLPGGSGLRPVAAALGGGRPVFGGNPLLCGAAGREAALQIGAVGLRIIRHAGQVGHLGQRQHWEKKEQGEQTAHESFLNREINDAMPGGKGE